VPYLKPVCVGFSSVETQIQSRETSCEICVARSGTRADLSPSPPLFHTHLSPPCKMCYSHNKSAHCPILGLKFGTSSLTWNLAGYRVRKLVYEATVERFCRHAHIFRILYDFPHFFVFDVCLLLTGICCWEANNATDSARNNFIYLK
jgi:hypothetical protein